MIKEKRAKLRDEGKLSNVRLFEGGEIDDQFEGGLKVENMESNAVK